MLGRIESFGKIAEGLAQSPLRIIALFIVLVYGVVSVTMFFSSHFLPTERQILIYFLVLFPVLVLAVFVWLVSKHSEKLYGPRDFKNEENFMKLQKLTFLLGAATAKTGEQTTDEDIKKVVDIILDSDQVKAISSAKWRNQILWVDDRPGNNTYERQAFEAMGLQFKLALSTDEALKDLSKNRYAAIISDMVRHEGSREGYVLLDQLRKEGNRTPLFFYASSNALEHIQETRSHGGQGCTNNPQELFKMVIEAVNKRLV